MHQKQKFKTPIINLIHVPLLEYWRKKQCNDVFRLSKVTHVEAGRAWTVKEIKVIGVYNFPLVSERLNFLTEGSFPSGIHKKALRATS